MKTPESTSPRTKLRSFFLTSIAITAVIVAACQGDSATGPSDPGINLPSEPVTLGAFFCRATPKNLSVSCDAAPDPLKQTLPSYNLGIDFSNASPSAILIGGQHINVDLTSTNITNNTTTHQFAFDVTVKNLRPQPIGTTDGTTSDSSLAVFFHSGPTTTGGTGIISVFNPDGIGTFTGAAQPFFKYGERLTQNQTSAARNWILQYDPTVTTFTFLLLINANVQHPNGYIDVFASGSSVSAGSTLQIQDSVRDALGVATADQSETWSLSDSSKATINSSGLLTGVAPGSVTVTATQGLKTGSMLVTVTGASPDAVNDAFTVNTGSSLNGDVTANNGSGADNLGNPPATVASFGGGSLGGTVTSNVAGASVALAGGTLTVNSNGTFSLTGSTTSGTYTFLYRLTNAVSSDDATVTINVRRVPDAKDDAFTVNTAATLNGNLTSDNGSGADDLGDPPATLTGFGGGSLAGNTTTNAAGASVPLGGGTLTVNANGTFSLVNPTTGGTYTFRYRLTNTAGIDSATATINVNAAPAAVNDAPTSNSVPGNAWHTAFNTALSTPSVTANDNLGFPAATVTSFGGGTLGGTVTTNAAGSTATFDGHSLTINSDGSFTYTPKTGFTGLFTTSYRITNAGGSSDATLTIAVGVRPTATNSTYGTTLLGNVGINTSTSTLTKVNATGDALVYNNVGATNGTGSVHTDGTYDFNPSLGFISGNGTLTFSVTNGFGTTANATVTLPVGATRVWFVASGGTGDGRNGTPLGCIVGASGCLSNLTLGSGDIVYIGSGTYSSTGALGMTAAMRIIGQGASGLFAAATNANVTWPADAGAQPATGGARPVLNSSGAGVLTLNNGNTIRGILIGNSTGVSVTGATVGNLAIGDAAIVNANGRAIDLSTSGALTVALDSIVATGGTGNGISLANQTGTFTSGITKITNPSAIGINVTSSAGFSFGTATVSKSSSGTGVNLGTNSGTTTFGALNITTSSGTALLTSSAGTVNIGGGTVSATGGPAVDATSTTFSGAGFTSTSSSSSAARGISLTSVAGTLALGTGSIATAATEDFFVSGGAATISYGGNITNTANRSVSISSITGGSVTLSGTISDTGTGILVQNNTGGTVSFSGASKVLNTGSNTAINLSTNTGATVSFIDSVKVNTTTGNGLSATGGGTLTVTGTHNSIASVGGIALTVTSTTIGASGLNFRSISANGGTNGIVLNNTGTGVLTVSGAGTSASGGTIQNVSLDGISLTDVQSPSFSWMSIANTGRSGIKGRRVRNFTLANSSINNVGTAAAGPHEESNIAFNDAGVFTDSAVSGTVSITNNSLTNARRHGIQIENGKGTISNLTITGNTLTSSTVATTSLGTAILVAQQGSASTTGHITTGSISNNTITNFPSAEGIAILGGSGNTSNNTSGTLGANGTPITISGNAISGGTGRLGSNAIRASFNGQFGVANFIIENNGTIASPITNIEGQGISVFMGGTVTGTTTINNNVIVANQTLGAGTQGLAVQIDDGPAGLGTSAADYNISITNNRVSNYEGNGIRAIARASNGKLDVTIQNNIVGTPILANRNGIRVDAGSAVGDVNVCMLMSGNTSDGSGVNQGIGLRKQGTVATTNDFGIVGLSPSPTTAANAAAFVAGQNPAGGGVDILSGDNFVSCTQTP